MLHIKWIDFRVTVINSAVVFVSSVCVTCETVFFLSVLLKMRNPWNGAMFMVSIGLLAFSARLIGAQFFDPKVNDKEYLDSIQNDVVDEVKESKVELMDQARIIQTITKNYIAARLKSNLFKALRVLAERELALDAMTMADRPRQPRQDEEGGDDGDETTRRNMLLPSVASLIKAVFGNNLNLTAYVESASQLLPKPISNQLIGVVKLLSTNPGDKYTTTTTTTTTTPTTTVSTTTILKEALKLSTAAPVTVKVTAPPAPPPQPPLAPVAAQTFAPVIDIETTTTEATTTPGDEDEDEDEFNSPAIYAKQQSNKNGRQLPSIPGLDILGNIGGALGKLFSGGNRNKDTEVETSKSKQPEAANKNKTSEASSGSGEEDKSTGMTNSMANKMNGIDIGSFAKEVRNGLGDLIKVMPDLFRGANEAYKLLSSVTSLFSRLEQPDLD